MVESYKKITVVMLQVWEGLFCFEMDVLGFVGLF